MRVRIKFTKEGCMKFIGHLDVMRYFQKALRRADFPVQFSEGYSPHMLMSFAAPLGVGVTSVAEYFDLDLKKEADSWTSEEMVSRLNTQMVEGIRILSVRKIPELKAAKGMTIVAAAAYDVTLSEETKQTLEQNEEYKAIFTNSDTETSFWNKKIKAFLQRPACMLEKKTKKGTKEVDILPWIYQLNFSNGYFHMLLSAGSVHNLKPQMLMDAMLGRESDDVKSAAYRVHRCEIFADPKEDHTFVSLEDMGALIE